ncbi:hypothetical protein SAMN02745148_01198 [Modicisalibacter ilicicola DSM 19980]|uniref:Lipoprotein n=1 Tax=Modicisalibacter ilicicola DSM 19980 TaxID=1121942 RepID=A0A1M4WGL9_9GAMM|nr:hypothetical protein [Halomonas ilicicola]SHE80327.1 hypothetical protein SAMN02745148_01198 [Halomonas ilicicola DSM 19980]
MKTTMRLMSAITLAALVGGCATSGSDPVPPAYDTSRGDGVPPADGFYLAEEASEERYTYQALMSNMLATAGTALLLSSNAGLGLSLGKSFGLGLAASMLEPSPEEEAGADSSRIPTAQAMTPEEMQAYVRASMQQAGRQALMTLGVSDQAIEQGLRYQSAYAQISGSTFVVSEQEGCLKRVGSDGSTACVLKLQFEAPVQGGPRARPLFAGNQGGVYQAPGDFGL